jgi:hypothetical protein
VGRGEKKKNTGEGTNEKKKARKAKFMCGYLMNL